VELNWAALAIPVFLGSTLVEAWLARRRGRRVYAFGTAIADLACGSVFQAGELLLKLLTFTAYIWLFERRFIDWSPSSPIPWLLGIIGVDFLFYWWHRTSHVVNVLWEVHGVHHQSEDYNLAVALRQPLLEPLTWFLFYGILALLGVSPIVYLISYALNRVYQFWIHTELVDKIGPLEWVLNTPSHHRVHHGVQDQYLDRNYGAILIVWDRWFGTFEPEGEPPIYGTTVPLQSYSPLWANFEHLARVRRLSEQARTPWERWWAYFAHPAWRPRGVLERHKVSRIGSAKYRPTCSRVVETYVLMHFALAGIALTAVVFFEHALTVMQLGVAALVLIVGFATATGLLEGKAWAFRLELWRIAAFPLAAAWLLRSAAGFSALAVTAMGLILVGFVAASLPLLRRRTPSPG